MQRPDRLSRGAHWTKPFQGQTEACPHITSYRPPQQAWTEARLCSTDQRLWPEVWRTEKLFKFPAVGLLAGSTVCMTPPHPPQEQWSSGRKATAHQNALEWDKHSPKSKTAPNRTWCPFAFLEEAFPLRILSLCSSWIVFLATKDVINLFSLITIIILHYSSSPFNYTPNILLLQLREANPLPRPASKQLALVWEHCPGPADDEGAAHVSEQTTAPDLVTGQLLHADGWGSISWLRRAGSQMPADSALAPALLLGHPLQCSVILVWYSGEEKDATADLGALWPAVTGSRVTVLAKHLIWLVPTVLSRQLLLAAVRVRT